MYSQNGAFYNQGYSQEMQISNEELKFIIDNAVDRTFVKVPNLMGMKVMEKFEKSLFSQNDQIMEIKAWVKRMKNNFFKNYEKYEKNIQKIGQIYCGIIEKLESYVEYYESVESALSQPGGLEKNDIDKFDFITNILGSNIELKSDQLININNQKVYLTDLKNALFDKITKLEDQVKMIIKDDGDIRREENNHNFSIAIENLYSIEMKIENYQNYNRLEVTNTNIRLGKNINCFKPKKASFAFYN
jgi:hypothetical protein